MWQGGDFKWSTQGLAFHPTRPAQRTGRYYNFSGWRVSEKHDDVQPGLVFIARGDGSEAVRRLLKSVRT